MIIVLKIDEKKENKMKHIVSKLSLDKCINLSIDKSSSLSDFFDIQEYWILLYFVPTKFTLLF